MNGTKRTVGVVGLGHVGLVTAAGFAELGFPVVGTDSDPVKRETIASGQAPFFEPGLEELVAKHTASGRLRVVGTLEEVSEQAEVIFICVGTPSRPDGSADLSQVEGVVRHLAKSARGYVLLVEKSTVPVETARWIKRTVRRYAHPDSEIDVASNPEFLREGSAVHDFLHPDRIVLGVDSERARAILEELYADLDAPKLVTDIETAEIIKHASNAFLATKISFINMVADLCEKTGADVTFVARGMGLDPRIGRAFLGAGLGYGGSCFPKDVKAFRYIGMRHGLDFSLLEAVDRINQSRLDRFLEHLTDALWVLKDKTLALWGLSFKPGTDDLREAASLKLIPRLLEEGARLRLHDPRAVEVMKKHVPERPPEVVYVSSPEEAAEGADAILLITEWPEYLRMDFQALRARVHTPVVIDGRNALNPEKVVAAGFEYYGMGKPFRSPTR